MSGENATQSCESVIECMLVAQFSVSQAWSRAISHSFNHDTSWAWVIETATAVLACVRDVSIQDFQFINNTSFFASFNNISF